jgi:hypothetical protein
MICLKWDYINEHEDAGDCKIQKDRNCESLIIPHDLRIERNSSHNTLADRNESDILAIVIQRHMICMSVLNTETGWWMCDSTFLWTGQSRCLFSDREWAFSSLRTNGLMKKVWPTINKKLNSRQSGFMPVVNLPRILYIWLTSQHTLDCFEMSHRFFNSLSNSQIIELSMICRCDDEYLKAYPQRQVRIVPWWSAKSFVGFHPRQRELYGTHCQ